MIAGTSTGGLIALFIGVKKYELLDALNIYLSGNPDTMRMQESFGILYDIGRFYSDAIEDEYREVYGKNDLLPKVTDNSTKVLITTTRVDKIPAETYLFKNYQSKDSKIKTIDDAFILGSCKMY